MTVDALVVVADAEHVEGRQAEQADQQDVGRREVLELVDEEVPAAPLHRGAERAVGENRLDRRVDLLVEVDDAAVGEGGAVPGNSSPSPSTSSRDRLDLVRVAKAQADRRQRLQVRARSDRRSPAAGGARAATSR